MSKIKLGDHFAYGPTTTTTTYQQPSPECDILVNKQKRKAYGKKKNKIYLNDGDHIQLNLLNPLYHRIGVQLEFNGEKEEKMLILNPGQKVLLDRFIDTKKKIKFGTYFIDGNNSAAKEVIKKNGNMIVHFWYEKPTYYSGSSFTNIGNVNQRPVTDNLGKQWMAEYNETTYSTLGNVNDMGLVNNSNSRIYPDYVTDNTINNIDYSEYLVDATKSIPKLEETGRVEKGNKSKQKMKETDFKVDKVFFTKEFKLLPFSKLKNKKKKSQSNKLVNNFKPKTVTVDAHSNYYRNTDHRIYCSNPLCGYRVRNQSWKFCPICSNELD